MRFKTDLKMILATTAILVSARALATESANSAPAKKGEYKALDMSEYRKNAERAAAPSPSKTGVKAKISCTNRTGQTIDAGTDGYEQCLSDYEATRNSRGANDKSISPLVPNSVGFTIGK